MSGFDCIIISGFDCIIMAKRGFGPAPAPPGKEGSRGAPAAKAPGTGPVVLPNFGCSGIHGGPLGGNACTPPACATLTRPAGNALGFVGPGSILQV
mmetsp:Transcript_7019/g.17005  ORF Transcript_7019/g.17005 Transcript_7019/m.17005 type:complete len:96 (+) Transcript_7019:727-1014(+)